jgi:hypothetical protein
MSQVGKCLAVLIACVCASALLVPVAQAAPVWQTVADPAPGATAGGPDTSDPRVTMTVAGTTPYVAWTAPDGALTVWRPNQARTAWVQVGERLDAPGATSGASLAADGSTVWVAWTDFFPSDDATVRVARLSGDTFREVGDGAQPANAPGTSAFFNPELAIAAHRVYVAFDEDTGRSSRPAVARVAADGGSYERLVSGLSQNGETNAQLRLGAAGGRVYLSYHGGGPVPDTVFTRLNAAGTAWENLADHTFDVRQMGEYAGALHLATSDEAVQRWTDAAGFEPVGTWPFEDAAPVSLASAGGLLYVAGVSGNSYDGFGPPAIAAYDGTSWTSVPVPTAPDEITSNVRLAPGSDGALWALYTTSKSHDRFPPFAVHVARYGEPPPPPEPPTPPGPPGPPAPGDPGDDDGGFTNPGGDPLPPADSGKPPLLRGACENVFTGTVRADRIVGSRFGDSIHGREGNDQLFGRGGSDCIWGGPANDVVSGGDGPDALAGGSGNDRIVPGGGRDDVSAGAGNDTIDAVGGSVDRVNCGPGRDVARVSPNDLIKGCEKVIVRR